jgi:hypothetical protein
MPPELSVADTGITRPLDADRHSAAPDSDPSDLPITRPEYSVAPTVSQDLEPEKHSDTVPQVLRPIPVEYAREATPAPHLDERINSEPRSTLLGNVAVNGFLAHQLVRQAASAAVLAAEKSSSTGQANFPRTVVRANFSPRAAKPQDNLQMDPRMVQVRDASVFGPGGLVEDLPPPHSVIAIAAATSGGNPELKTIHRDVLRLVDDALTERVVNPTTGQEEIIRPNLVQQAEGVGVVDRARDSQEYPDAPQYLDDTQIKRIQAAANTDRTAATPREIGLLRVRLTNILEDTAGGAEEAAPAPGTALLPVVRDTPVPGQGPLVRVSQLGVSPNAYDELLDAEVQALASGVLTAVSNMNGNTMPALIIEGAEELAKRAPDKFDAIQAACERQQPPIPLTTVFSEASEKIAPYVHGDITLAFPLDSRAADENAKLLPPLPMEDFTSKSNGKGANDGVSVGVTGNKGYDPDKVTGNSGTSSTAGAAGGTNANYGEVVSRNTRTPRGSELNAIAGPKQAVRYNADGTFDGVYDLQQRGARISTTLPGQAQEEEPFDARPDIERVEEAQERARQAAMRRAAAYGEPVDPEGTMLMPQLPPQPKAPIGSKRQEVVHKLPISQQIKEVSLQHNQGGKVTPELLRGPVMDEWQRQAGPETVNSHYAEEEWVHWCVERGQSQHAARTAWSATHGRVLGA